ncbi:MAG TPA: molybdenum cofactor guanylyltransferase [Planctomycetaceae bacterium]|nr:molybdenum cofactor guanylyltransferase [Planctomycetaceae bacterium]
MITEQQTCGIVLCGGKSQRMGREKYRLMFGNETLLQRICRIVQPEVSQILVVASLSQEMPDFEISVEFLRDEIPESGPLAGITQALTFLENAPSSVIASFVTSCDVPLLKPTVIRLLRNQLTDDFDAVVVRDIQYAYPLCALYRTPAATTARRLLASGERRAAALADNLRTCWVSTEQIRTVDPDLTSLWNCNSPDDLTRALDRAKVDITL